MSVVREMFGVLAASNASKVIVISSGHFTQQAIDFAAGKSIVLLSGKDLLSLVYDVQMKPQIEPEKQISCPRCGSELVERQAKRGNKAGNIFLGCASFPTCRYIK